MTAVLSSVFECQSRPSTGQPLRYQPSQSVWSGTRIEQTIPDKCDESIEFIFAQLRIRPEQQVQSVQHRLYRTRTLQIRGQQRRVVRSGAVRGG
jgi:hypothetical protein